jgi:uncharacterized repeat protein (TIGR01451 family)
VLARSVFFIVITLSVGVPPAVAQTISSGTNQIFNVGSPDKRANAILISDNVGTINTVTGIRIVIPTGLNLQWSDTVTTLDVSGSAAGQINPMPTYSANGDTLTIEVTADWTAGNQLIISNLVFTNFTATNGNQRLRLTAGAVTNEPDNRSIKIRPPVSMESQNDQIFVVGDTATAASQITITEAGGIPQIKAADDIRIRIPAGFSMTWNTAVTTAIIGGPAASSVSPTVSYENAGQVLVIDVLTDFSADEQITVAGLGFTNFTAPSAPDSLELVLDPAAGTTAATDHQSKTIIAKVHGVAVSPHLTTANRLPSNGTHYTVAFTVHDTSTGTGPTSYVLLTSRRHDVITTVSITGTGVTQGSNPDSAEVVDVPAGGAALATVTYSVDDGAEGAVDTLVFLALAIGSPATHDTGALVVVRVKPSLTVTKSVSPSGTTVPNTDLTYTTTLTNVGSEKATALVHVDSVPPQLGFQVGSVSTTLPNGMTATIAYSNDDGNTWTYVPVSAGCGAPAGYDYCVKDIRTLLGGALNGNGPNNTVQIVFIAKVK